MRIVRWAPQERVDVPDITSMSFLVLGEFRRFVRGVLLGPSSVPATERHNQSIIRGFAVEPQAVPDSTIRVRLDPGADILGFAIGAENLGARKDLGVLMGGDDAAGNTEGNANTTLDFSALPSATYIVEIRTVVADGANDNRAFWDAGTNAEFIAATDTRHLPAYELRTVTATVSGDEWQALGIVVWDGAGPITTAEITDFRTFPHEGTAGFFITANSNQDSSDGSGDFDRALDRGGAGVNEVYPVMRALARQIRDLKGPIYQSTAAGQRWDWFSRPFAPLNYTGAALPFGTEHTKSLASVETVTYTVGDGIATWGDFNGADGLEQCLDVIVGNAGVHARPRRVKILMKAGNRDVTTFLVNNIYDFTTAGDIHIEIEGMSTNNALGDRGQVEIEFTGAGADFHWLTARGFTLRNLDLRVTTERQGLMRCGEIDAYNTSFRTTTDSTTLADLTAGNYALDINRIAGAREVRIDSCEFSGGAVRVLDASSDFLTPFNRHKAARILSSTFGSASPLVLNDITNAGGTDTVRCSAGLIVEGCEFFQNSVLQTGYVGSVDARIAENITLRDCQFNGSTREADIIHCGTGAGAGSRANPANLLIDSCLFNLGFVRTSAVDAGLNGVVGTGWAILIRGSGINLVEDEESVTIRNCMFEGGTGANLDSGAIFLRGLGKAKVTGNHFHNFSAGAAERSRIIELGATGGAGPGRQIVIAHNHFDKFAVSNATGEVVCVYVHETEGVRIHDNNFRGKTDVFGNFAGSPTLSAAIIVQNTGYFDIHNNHFEGFDDQDFCVAIEPVVGTGCRFFKVAGNTFDEVGEANAGSFAIGTLQASAVEEGVISNNLIKTGAFGAGINIPGTANMVVNGNNVQASASADAVGIQWGTVSATSMCSGNRVNGQTIAGGGAGVIHGFQLSARNDLNFFP